MIRIQIDYIEIDLIRQKELQLDADRKAVREIEFVEKF